MDVKFLCNFNLGDKCQSSTCRPKFVNWEIIHKVTINSHHGHAKLHKMFCGTRSPVLCRIQSLANINERYAADKTLTQNCNEFQICSQSLLILLLLQVLLFALCYSMAFRIWN